MPLFATHGTLNFEDEGGATLVNMDPSEVRSPSMTLSRAQLMHHLKLIRRANNGSRLHAAALALAISRFRTDHICRAVSVFARTLSRFGTEWGDGNARVLGKSAKRALPVDDMENALLGLSTVSKDLYARRPRTRALMLSVLPHLFRWAALATERLLMGTRRTRGLKAIRPRLLACIDAAVRVCSTLQRDGCAFLRENGAHHWGVDLWLQLPGSTSDEDAILAMLLVSCKHGFDGAQVPTDTPFAKYVLERAASHSGVTPARVVALAERRFRRALTRVPTDEDQLESDVHAEMALDVLAIILSTPTAPCDIYRTRRRMRKLMRSVTLANVAQSLCVLGLTISVLGRICVSSQSPRVLLVALKGELVQFLVAATLGYSTLDPEGREALSVFVSNVLPDALLFSSVFERCGALAMPQKFRQVVLDASPLRDRWNHLFQVYDLEKPHFEGDMRRSLKTCDNVRFPFEASRRIRLTYLPPRLRSACAPLKNRLAASSRSAPDARWRSTARRGVSAWRGSASTGANGSAAEHSSRKVRIRPTPIRATAALTTNHSTLGPRGA